MQRQRLIAVCILTVLCLLAGDYNHHANPGRLQAQAMSAGIQHTPLLSDFPRSMPVVQKTKIRLAFTGDLMVHEWQLDSAYNREDGTYTFTSFEEITPYLKNADYTLGNLETTFAGKDKGYGAYPLFNTPDAFAEALKAAGFNFLTTANNHCLDKREYGLLRTLEVLDEQGIAHTGTFASQEDQESLSIINIKGVHFAFLSFTYGTNGIPVTKDKPYLVNGLDESLIKSQIEQARAEGADVVIVMPHMGIEYAEKPSEPLIKLARDMCLWGADAVMASHPHVLQPTEIFEVQEEDGTVRTCFIAYSMGNFISSQRTVPRDASAVFYLEYENTCVLGQTETKLATKTKLAGASFAPTWVQFVNARRQYDIRVLPVYDTLQAFEEGNTPNLRPSDINRIRAVHRETTRKLLGMEIPLADAQPEYALFP